MNVFLAVAAWRSVEPATLTALFGFQRHAMLQGHTVGLAVQQGDALVGRARSRLATQFLDDAAWDVFLSVDTDVHFPAQPALRACIDAVSKGQIIGGLYVTRSRPCQPAAILPTDVRVELGKVYDCDLLATGFMAVPREALTRIQAQRLLPLLESDGHAPFRPFFQSHWIVPDGEIGPGVFLSEDQAFCTLARACGVRTVLDTRVRIAHVGDAVYTVNDLAPPLGPPRTVVALRRAADGVLFVETAPVVSVEGMGAEKAQQ